MNTEWTEVHLGRETLRNGRKTLRNAPVTMHKCGKASEFETEGFVE